MDSLKRKRAERKRELRASKKKAKAKLKKLDEDRIRGAKKCLENRTKSLKCAKILEEQQVAALPIWERVRNPRIVKILQMSSSVDLGLTPVLMFGRVEQGNEAN